jgi:hypothetical protein
VLDVGLLPGVRARRAGRRRRREELEDAQRLGPVGERVVPGVPAEEDLLAGPDALDLAGLGVGDDERALEHVQHLVGGEDGAVGLRVPERPARAEPEHEDVHALRRGVDPVEDLARLRVAPDVARDVGAADERGPVERRAGRGGGGEEALDGAHAALRGSWIRRWASASSAARSPSSSGAGKSLMIGRARPSAPAACAASMISSAW